jgi:hypothetical protein
MTKVLNVCGMAVKFLEWFYCVTYREPCNLIVVNTCLCMFRLALVTISTHYRQLCGSWGADKKCVFTSCRTNEW